MQRSTRFKRSPAAARRAITSGLLAWYHRSRRDLPWRRTRDPYRVWLSEIMLQQTQVATVIPYFRRFLSRFPRVDDLAAASLDEVLRLWAGLGYYARGRNLHRAAQAVIDHHGGAFPESASELAKLPGIGQYTAGAIASICFGQRVPAVDCNVQRVLARLFAIEEQIDRPAARQQLVEIANSLLPTTECGDFNQALIELGATVCLPGAAARCDACPVRRYCAAQASGRAAELPAKTRKPAVRRETHIVAAIEHRGRFLFRRRPLSGLWGGLWELPSAILIDEPPHELVRTLISRNSCAPQSIAGSPFCAISHQLTHRLVRFEAYRCCVKRGPHDRNARWLSPRQATRIGLSVAMRRVLDQLEADIKRA